MSEKLSKEDKERVKNCEHYVKTTKVLKNLERDKGIGVDEVYFIKYKNYDGKYEYETAGWSNEPAKYMVFHKDKEGFVFIKRIIASGNLGKEVQCLTTQYDAEDYILEPDPDYVNSILLQNEDGYDPLASSKQMSAKKNKARRRNKKIELNFEEVQEAYDYIKALKVGDVIYDAETAYGSGVVKWKIINVTTKKVDTKDGSYSRFSNGSMYRMNDRHISAGFNKIVNVEIEADEHSLPSSRRYISKTKNISFSDFYGYVYNKFYKSKPFTVEDV